MKIVHRKAQCRISMGSSLQGPRGLDSLQWLSSTVFDKVDIQFPDSHFISRQTPDHLLAAASAAELLSLGDLMTGWPDGWLCGWLAVEQSGWLTALARKSSGVWWPTAACGNQKVFRPVARLCRPVPACGSLVSTSTETFSWEEARPGSLASWLAS